MEDKQGNIAQLLKSMTGFQTELPSQRLAVPFQMIENKIKPLLSLACFALMLFCRSTPADGLKVAAISKEARDRARDATVRIYVKDFSWEDYVFSGSGFFVAPHVIATNFHVIEDKDNSKGKSILAYKHSKKGRFHSVKSVRGVDRTHDLAILEVSASSVKPLFLGDSSAVESLDKVYIVGNPMGYERKFSQGIISGEEELAGVKYIQTDAAISPGSSGGPMIDFQGEVIGIATRTHIFVGENLGFAIPSNHLKALLMNRGVRIPPKPKPVDPEEEERRKAEAEKVKAEITRQLKAATVHIFGRDRNGNEGRLGSGFFVHKDKVATDFHVVDGSTLKRVRRLGRGTTSDDLLLAEQPPKTDKKHHLAILKIKKADVGALSLGNSDDVGIGGEIYLVGDPASGEVSEGKISDILEKDGVRYFEFDAQVSPGSSGGPIVNSKGEVIAVTALKVPELSGTLKYAIPAIYLKGLLAGRGDPPPLDPRDPAKPGDSPKTMPSSLLLHERLLQTGIGLYEKSRFKDAIESLESAMNGLHDPEIRANAHLYLGFSKWGLADTKSSVSAEFREALRYNPSATLPDDVGQDHPVFKPLLEKARQESTGILTITASPPETEIKIYGGEVQPKLPDDRTEPIRLFKGNYAVEGILDGAHKVMPVLIEPGDRRGITLRMQKTPVPEHEFELTLDLYSAEKPKEVMVHYTTYDASGNQLGPEEKKEMQLREHKPETSIWVYHVKLPSATQGGKIVYRIETDGEVIPGRPMEVEILEPPEIALIEANQSIPIKARVISNVEVSEVRVVYDAPTMLADTSLSQKLEKESSSNTYKGKIPARRNHSDGTTWYYVTATNKSGENAISATRAVRAKRLSRDPPKIAVIKPPGTGPLPINRPINFEAKVKSSAPLKEVRVYYNYKRKGLSEASFSTILENKSSGTYIGQIPKEHNQEERTIWYFVTASTRKGIKSKSEVRSVEIVEPPSSHDIQHQGIWASHSWSSYLPQNGLFSSDWERGDVASIAYLSEGKGFQTLGARLDFSYENPMNTSATVQWGPPMKESPMGFAFLGGIAGYRSSEPSFSRTIQSTQITPILGGSLKFYPLDNVAVDVTGSRKLRSENSDADRNSSFTKKYLHHYEMGIRLYISPTLNLKAGYGEWRIGEYNNTSVLIGLGSTF